MEKKEKFLNETIAENTYGELLKYGYDTFYGGQGDIGRVISAQKGRFSLISEYGELIATIKSSAYYIDDENAFPAVGDFVEFIYNEIGESKITKTLPRKSLLRRLDPSSSGRKYQQIAANVDYAFILTSANKDFNLRKIQRYLAVVMGSGVTPIIILSKVDLVENQSEFIEQLVAIAPETRIIAVSSTQNTGLEEVKSFVNMGVTCVFIGSSGVGKSTLVNTIAGKEIMDTAGIREDDSHGRHTTTSRQMIMLENGGIIIDTPGMRELGLWTDNEGVSQVFASIIELGNECRFSDCSHTNEPGCAVLKALEEGRITQSDYQNYMKLTKEVKRAEQAQKAKRENSERKFLRSCYKKR
ncbi:MAG TPA: ribosome small subunit-dependent GTPase A [Clostridia bacterium]|nr:ribosome small subunit-dependent GTPase A [Clostridia bacterium]